MRSARRPAVCVTPACDSAFAEPDCSVWQGRKKMTPVMIVGLGRIGMEYDLELDPSRYVYSHARAFSQHPAFRLVAGVDPAPERRRMFEAAYGGDAQEHLDVALR